MATLYYQTINQINQSAEIFQDTKKWVSVLSSKMAELAAIAIESLDTDSTDLENVLMDLYLTAVKMDLVLGVSNMKKFTPSGKASDQIDHELKRAMLVNSLIQLAKYNGTVAEYLIDSDLEIQKNSGYAIAITEIESLYEAVEDSLEDTIQEIVVVHSKKVVSYLGQSIEALDTDNEENLTYCLEQAYVYSLKVGCLVKSELVYDFKFMSDEKLSYQIKRSMLIQAMIVASKSLAKVSSSN